MNKPNCLHDLKQGRVSQSRHLHLSVFLILEWWILLKIIIQIWKLSVKITNETSSNLSLKASEDARVKINERRIDFQSSQAVVTTQMKWQNYWVIIQKHNQAHLWSLSQRYTRSRVRMATLMKSINQCLTCSVMIEAVITHLHERVRNDLRVLSMWTKQLRIRMTYYSRFETYPWTIYSEKIWIKIRCGCHEVARLQVLSTN